MSFSHHPSGREFILPSVGSLILPSANESELAAGWARLRCSVPVVAQVLYVLKNPSGRTAGTATVFSSQRAAVFQFPVLGQETSLAFAIANIGS